MVFAVKTRRAVVAATGGEGSAVERLHGGLIARDEGTCAWRVAAAPTESPKSSEPGTPKLRLSEE